MTGHRTDVEGTDIEEEVSSETLEDLQEPPLYRVLLHNDDYTTMEFVIQVLMEVFHKPPQEAMEIMLHVHRNGIGVCGLYSREVAETKVLVVEEMARQNGFPLKCTMEEEP